MDFRQLRYFVAVAEELSFSRAAERLHMSQPPLSVQIKAMEEELGTVLLDRTRQNVALTGPGQLLLTHAKAALRELDRAGDLVRRAGRGEAGTIRMGFVGSVPMLDLFPHVLSGFRQAFPYVRIDLHHQSTNRQLAALVEGKIDVGFVRLPPSHGIGAAMQVTTVWTDRLCLFLPEGHALAAGDDAVDLANLAAEEFIGIAAGVGCGVHELAAFACTNARFMPRIVQEAHDLRTVLWLVAGGTGVALLPECYGRAGVARVVSRSLRGPPLMSRISMVSRRDARCPLLERFIAHAALFPLTLSAGRPPQ